jgi:DNA-binding GntR family transcriptional regulator/transposase-like protein
MANDAYPLPPEDREELLHVTRSRRVTHGQGVRARVVLDCAEVGVTEAARRASVSTTSASRWWRLYREGGVERLLAITPARGRPTVTVDALHEVLGCTLREPPVDQDRWTTRTIAAAAGVSQPTVSRIRRTHFPMPDGPNTDETLMLTYLDIGAAGCALGVQRLPGDVATTTPSAVLTDTVETVLCAALLRRPVDGYQDAAPPDPVALLHRAARHLDAVTPTTLVIDVPLNPGARRWLSRHPTVTVVTRVGADWLAQLHRLAGRIAPAQLRELRELQTRIWAAAAADATELTWTRNSPRTVEPRPTATVPAAHTSVHDMAVTVAALCAAISEGELSIGDAIAPRVVSDRSGLSRQRVVEVLNYLVEEAILDRNARWPRLPAPTPQDVIETYTARGLLGTALVRRMAARRIAPPSGVIALLDRIMTCAEHGLETEAYAFDMDLQDQLALAAGMPRISWMFVQLTAQVRLFIAILGLDYRYPTAEIIVDDRRIIDEIRSGDPGRAVAAWRIKVDNCVRYMLQQLPGEDHGTVE